MAKTDTKTAEGAAATVVSGWMFGAGLMMEREIPGVTVETGNPEEDYGAYEIVFQGIRLRVSVSPVENLPTD